MTEDRNIQDILAEVADQAERTRDEVTKMYRSKRPAVEPSQVYSIRIPVSRLGRIRALANKYGMAPTAMLRSWILERLDAEERSSGNPPTPPASIVHFGHSSTDEVRIYAVPYLLGDAQAGSSIASGRKLRESFDRSRRRRVAAV